MARVASLACIEDAEELFGAINEVVKQNLLQEEVPTVVLLLDGTRAVIVLLKLGESYQEAIDVADVWYEIFTSEIH